MDSLIKRIKQLRNFSGLSQEQVGALLGMSRLTYANIESGKRDIKKKELEKLAHIFETSVEELISTTMKTKTVTKDHPLYKMMQTVLYILSKTAGKPNVGKIVLNKLLYFADFNHYEKYRESISGDSYIKMPMGPIPKSIDGVLALLEKSWYIQSITTNYYGYTQQKFIPTRSPDLTIFKATETQELDEVVEQYGDKNGKWMTDYSHGDMPYQATEKIGETIDYELVHYRSPVYSVSTMVNERN